MEFELNDDPMVYETRPIFGSFSRREALIGGSLSVIVGAVTALAWKLNADPVILGGVCAIIAMPIGAFGLSRRHGLLPESWIPLVRLERSAPFERIWTAPKAVFTNHDTSPQKLNRKEAKRIRKIRMTELESDDLLTTYLEKELEDTHEAF